eukprot:scaffold4562_cov178-Amphora_coffeaeformis.AAC.4
MALSMNPVLFFIPVDESAILFHYIWYCSHGGDRGGSHLSSEWLKDTNVEKRHHYCQKKPAQRSITSLFEKV